MNACRFEGPEGSGILGQAAASYRDHLCGQKDPVLCASGSVALSEKTATEK